MQIARFLAQRYGRAQKLDLQTRSILFGCAMPSTVMGMHLDALPRDLVDMVMMCEAFSSVRDVLTHSSLRFGRQAVMEFVFRKQDACHSDQDLLRY